MASATPRSITAALHTCSPYATHLVAVGALSTACKFSAQHTAVVRSAPKAWPLTIRTNTALTTLATLKAACVQTMHTLGPVKHASVRGSDGSTCSLVQHARPMVLHAPDPCKAPLATSLSMGTADPLHTTAKTTCPSSRRACPKCSHPTAVLQSTSRQQNQAKGSLDLSTTDVSHIPSSTS